MADTRATRSITVVEAEALVAAALTQAANLAIAGVGTDCYEDSIDCGNSGDIYRAGGNDEQRRIEKEIRALVSSDAQAALDAILREKEEGVAKHIRGGASDGCMCEPCISVRAALDALVREARLDEQREHGTHARDCGVFNRKGQGKCNCGYAARLAQLKAEGQREGKWADG